ncbi:MAG: hypothetical protein KQH63_13660 [Desulfobulbaceae bacterium]|nr:hypothetical protein [Desulfobulbaceae bacterium]
MIDPVRYRFQFYLERFLLRGAHYRLLFIAALIGLISIVFGGAARYFSNDFATNGEAFWWAFLRLTDPGYLGDDKGMSLRIISTIVTVLGYVIFMGSLIAIMTQWLNETIRKLEAGLTPISIHGHVIILGWTSLTPSIVRELVQSESRVKRFLERTGSRRLRIAILSESASPAQRHELEVHLGEDWDERQVIFRSGTPLRNEHLIRVDYLHAAAIILPGHDFAPGGSDTADMRTVKTLMSIANYARQQDVTLPYMVAEIFDARKVEVAKSAYPGHLETVASDATISLLVAQNIRHPWLSYIYTELLSHSNGDEIRIRRLPELKGATAESLTDLFPKAILLGVLRKQGDSLTPVLNPPAGFVIQEHDWLVFMACNHADTNPDPSKKPTNFPRGEYKNPSSRIQRCQRVLLLGWNDMIPALIHELDNYENEIFEVDVFSSLPTEQRQERLNRFALNPEKVTVELLEGDYTVPSSLLRIDVLSYDNIVILGCDWLPSPEEADARTILGFMMLRNLLVNETDPPKVLLELLDPENQALFTNSHEEVILSPHILSHIMAHVALMPELNLVFKELFGSGGAEIYLRSCAHYGLDAKDVSFTEIQKQVSRQGEIALGVRMYGKESLPDGGIELNPPRHRSWHFRKDDEIVVLTTSV